MYPFKTFKLFSCFRDINLEKVDGYLFIKLHEGTKFHLIVLINLTLSRHSLLKIR